MAIHVDLSPSSCCLIVLLGHKPARLPSMSTIELVDPELRDALAQQLPPLTAEFLTQRRASALELAEAVPKPNLPDIATDEIYVESAFGAKPIRVLTYRPVTSDAPTARYRTHPWRGLRHGRAGNEGCGEQAVRVRAEMRDLFRRSSPRAGITAPGASRGHLLGLRLAARERRPALGLIPPASVSRAKVAAAVSRRAPPSTPATGRDQNSPFSI